MSLCKFVEYPKVKLFRADQLSNLDQELDFISNVTSIEPVADIRDILLNKDYKTESGGYGLTTTALSQLCRALCPGLIKVVTDLAGIGVILPQRYLNPDLAVGIYNNIAKARFDQLGDKSLVRQLKAKRIEGIIGAGYRTLSNKAFFELTQDATATISANFYEAEMIGRTLVLCYIFKDPIVSRPEPYYGGFYFTNSEVGDCSVKIASLVLRIKTGERAILPFRRGRMVHIGRSFASRVRRAVYDAVSKPWPIEWLKSRLSNLNKLTLGFTGSDEKKLIARADHLVAKLSKRLGSQLAERAIYSALYQGRELIKPKAYEIGIKRDLWKARTVYDLFISLMRDAKNRTLPVREALEKAAYDVLQGTITI